MLRKLGLSLIILIALPFVTYAQTHVQKLDQLLDLIEYSEIFDDVRPSVLGLLETGQVPKESLLGIKWKAATAEHFDDAQMREKVEAELLVALPEADLDILIPIFSDDFARRISKLELNAQNEGTPEFRTAKGAEIALELANANPDRMELYFTMMETLGMVDQGVSIVMNVQYALLSGASANNILPALMTDAEILQQIGSFEPQIRSYMFDSILGFTAFTYQSLSDDEVAKYIDILNRLEVSRFYSILGQVAGDVLTAEFAAFAAKLGQLPDQRDL
ncbi:MAG: hypothetical protein ACI861_001787 [Paracoccaceae bacterium]|jgi:hypothetical protein